MKILSWNVNGIRARIAQGFGKAIEEMNPDIICIQEVRANEKQLPKDFLSEYNHYHSIHQKAGYAGSSIFVKKELPAPISVKTDYDNGSETGRVCILEFENFILIGSYSPNSGQNLEKLHRRVEWETGLTEFMRNQVKPIILCGDLNVAPEKQDAGIWCLAGCSPEERKAFKEKLDLGMVDVFRYLNPTKIDYTWFSNRSKTKVKGLRLDQFVVSKELCSRIQSIEHLHNDNLVCGSDHIPIILNIK